MSLLRSALNLNPTCSHPSFSLRCSATGISWRRHWPRSQLRSLLRSPAARCESPLQELLQPPASAHHFRSQPPLNALPQPAPPPTEALQSLFAAGPAPALFALASHADGS